MSEYMDLDRFPVRKNPRMKNYDYSTPNYYFITICTWEKACIFGPPGRLNLRGRAAEAALLEIEMHFPGVRVDKYVIMPNHIHMILDLHDEKTKLPVVVGQFKAAVSKRIHKSYPGLKVWQASFHDHVIRGQEEYARIWGYIDTNPIKWQEDCFYSEQAPSDQQI